MPRQGGVPVFDAKSVSIFTAPSVPSPEVSLTNYQNEITPGVSPVAVTPGIAWRIWLVRRIRYPLGAHFLRVGRILHVNMRLAV